MERTEIPEDMKKPIKKLRNIAAVKGTVALVAVLAALPPIAIAVTKYCLWLWSNINF